MSNAEASAAPGQIDLDHIMSVAPFECQSPAPFTVSSTPVTTSKRAVNMPMDLVLENETNIAPTLVVNTHCGPFERLDTLTIS